MPEATHEEKLAEYQLRRDPFGPDYDVRMAGREAEWREILERVEQAMYRRGNDIVVILGDYGIGKTYTLWKMHEHYKDRHDLCVTRPLSLLSSESTSRFAVDLIGRTLRQGIGYGQVIDLIRQADNSWQESVDNPAVLDLLRDLASEEPTTRDRALDRLARNRDNLIAREILFAFQFVLAAAGPQALLWLVDEFEYIMILTSTKVSQLVNTLRDIYDHQPEVELRYGPERSAKIILTLASSPAGWELLQKLTQDVVRKTGGAGVVPFAQRIPGINIITLAPLNRDGCHDLIAWRLAKNRAGDVPGEPLIPYDEGFVDLVLEVAQGVPRRILAYATVVLLGALEQGLPRITVDAAHNILEKEGFLSKT
jgi:type II secretory pathway predicted ATPase ExeA